MGQNYTVHIDGGVKDPALLVALTNKYIATENFSANCWNKSDLKTAAGCIRAILAGDTQPEAYVCELESDGNTHFCNSFYCCYSWEGILERWFYAVAPSLKDGTTIDVYPDEGKWKLEVEGGKVK